MGEHLLLIMPLYGLVQDKGNVSASVHERSVYYHNVFQCRTKPRSDELFYGEKIGDLLGWFVMMY